MLCKTSVARNICIELAKNNFKADCIIAHFDNKKVFDINVSACLLICDFRSNDLLIKQCDIDDFDNLTLLEFDGKALRAELSEELSPLLGTTQLKWRQGVKHDCAKVMELHVDGDNLRNKLGETINVEDAYLYPYIKSSASREHFISGSQLRVPMTQRKIGDDTSGLKTDAPLL